MEKDLELKDIKGFIKRRKKTFIISFLLVFLCALSLAIILPPIYKSQASIQLKDQQIPTDYVKPTITDFAEERIQKISQQVLSRPKLLEIIDGFDLYKDLKDKKSETELASKIRKSIGVEAVTAEKSQKKGRNASTVTVAFNIFFEGKEPTTVQKVTDKLSKLFLEEDVKDRESMVTGATNFLENEIERLKKEMNLMERKISNYKKKHLRELPSDSGYNLQAIGRLERQMDQTEMRLGMLEEKKLLLESQLTTIEPLTPVVIGGKDLAANPKERLKALRLELSSLRSVYSEKHPDIKKIKREIAKLEKEVKNSNDHVAKVKRLNQLEVQLASAQSELGPNHPDVKAINNEIKVLKKQVNSAITESAKIQISEEKPDNPAYISLQTQIETNQMQIRALQEEKEKLSHELDVYQQRIEIIPQVEKELNALNRDYDNLKKKYSEMSNKLMNAQVVQEMEGKQKGKRFNITSPAYLPQKPSKPNRFAIILLGFLISIGLSSVLVVALESVDNTVKTSDQLGVLTGVPVLTSISYIVTDQERRSNFAKKLGWTFLAICCLGVVIYCVDKYVIELERLWAFILDRLRMII